MGHGVTRHERLRCEDAENDLALRPRITFSFVNCFIDTHCPSFIPTSIYNASCALETIMTELHAQRGRGDRNKSYTSILEPLQI